MARSAEAIQRRALKRQRTEDEQREIDRKDMMEETKRRKQKKPSANHDNNGNDDDKGPKNLQSSTAFTNDEQDPMKEDGAWTCQSCGNGNFASRKWCNSKTCNERRPHDLTPTKTFQRPSGAKSFAKKRQPYSSSSNDPRDEEGAWTCPSCEFRNFASRETCKGLTCTEPRPEHLVKADSSTHHQPRHDPETSKTLIWSKQADSKSLSKNQELRKRYQETGGEGMSEADVERAKILIARDERKRLKKQEKGQGTERDGSGEQSIPSQTSSSDQGAGRNATETKDNNHKHNDQDAKKSSDDSKIKRAENKKIQKRFLATGGKDMTEEEVERAKVLIARKERKQKRRAAAALLEGGGKKAKKTKKSKAQDKAVDTVQPVSQ